MRQGRLLLDETVSRPPLHLAKNRKPEGDRSDSISTGNKLTTFVKLARKFWEKMGVGDKKALCSEKII